MTAVVCSSAGITSTMKLVSKLRRVLDASAFLTRNVSNENCCVSLQVDPALGIGLGTPAAAALMPGGTAAGDGLPTVARMYNLYQPYDPVAYRRAAAGTDVCHKRLG